MRASFAEKTNKRIDALPGLGRGFENAHPGLYRLDVAAHLRQIALARRGLVNACQGAQLDPDRRDATRVRRRCGGFGGLDQGVRD
jgi:hypothetical protein